MSSDYSMFMYMQEKTPVSDRQLFTPQNEKNSNRNNLNRKISNRRKFKYKKIQIKKNSNDKKIE